MRKVKDFKISKDSSIEKIIEMMENSAGFQAKNLAIATKILEEVIKEKNILKFLSFPADIIATGTRGIIRDFLKNKWFDIVITTCGTLDHDIARSFKNYYHGSFFTDDKKLLKKGIHRLGNILIPKSSYGLIIEKKMMNWLKEISLENKKISTYELCWEIGKRLKEDSILYWSYKNKIPIIVPGITDGAVGYQIWQFCQLNKNFELDIMKDEQLLSDLIWNCEKSACLIIGGGISKHHVIWWNQFKKGLDYAVYITTAIEQDGSLSGALTKEAISWGKINERAKNVNLFCEATIALPIIHYYLSKKLEPKEEV